MEYTAYKTVSSSSVDFIFQLSMSRSTNAAIIKNCISPKKHVNEVSVNLAGYFFSTGACQPKIKIKIYPNRNLNFNMYRPFFLEKIFENYERTVTML